MLSYLVHTRLKPFFELHNDLEITFLIQETIYVSINCLKIFFEIMLFMNLNVCSPVYKVPRCLRHLEYCLIIRIEAYSKPFFRQI